MSSSQARVLLVDAEPAVRQVVGSLLSAFFHVSLASSEAEAQEQLARQRIDLMLLGEDPARRIDGSRLIERARAVDPDLPVITLAAAAPPAGAPMTFAKAVLGSEAGRASLLLAVDRGAVGRRRDREVAFRRQQTQRAARTGANLFIGTSAAAARVREAIHEAARSDLNLLLTGETGVGKTRVAETVHASGRGSEAPFVVVEPATVPPSLFESELFGHARGAFTGATASQIGAFEAAEDGTLFLEEIGDLPAELQVKLLRAVETKVIRRIGDTRDIHLRVRIIAATNRALEADVAGGRFRPDLYQRLNELRLHIPPLRERREDIIPLFEHFLGELMVDRHKPCNISGGAEKLLTQYPWPGNVRELRTLVRRLSEQGLPDEISEATVLRILPARLDRGGDSDLGPDDRIRVFSRRVYLEELRKHGFNIRQTARALRLPYPTLRSRLRSLDLLKVLEDQRGLD